MFPNLSHLHIVLFRRVMRWSWEMTKATESNEGLCSENFSLWNTSPIIAIFYFQKHHHLRKKGQKATKKILVSTNVCVSFWQWSKHRSLPHYLFSATQLLLHGGQQHFYCGEKGSLPTAFDHLPHTIISCGKMLVKPFVLMQSNCFAAFKSNI